MSNDYVKIGGIYFREDQVKSATYGGGLNGSHNVELMNGSLFVFGQQPAGKFPDYVLEYDGFEEERPSVEIRENGKICVRKSDIELINNCKGKKDFYEIIDSNVNKLNLEEQDYAHKQGTTKINNINK